MVSQLSHAIKKVAERVTNAPETVEFDYFSSTNFIGLFITEQFAALLKQITTDFSDEMKKAGNSVRNIPAVDALHIHGLIFIFYAPQHAGQRRWQ